MEMLYQHVQESHDRQVAAQRRITELEHQVKTLSRQPPALAEGGARPAAGPGGDLEQYLPAAAVPRSRQVNGGMGVTIHGDHARVLQMDVKVMAQPQAPNRFGQEKVDHINRGSMYDMFVKVVPRALPPATADDPMMLNHLCSQLVTRAAMLIYSDPDHPENITCYLPKMTGSHAMTYGEFGWTLQPVSIVVTPMMRRSVDLLFEQQPVAGEEGCPEAGFSQDRKAAFKKLLEFIVENEEQLAMHADTTMRPVLVGNADLLRRVCQAFGRDEGAPALPVSRLVRQALLTAPAVTEVDT